MRERLLRVVAPHFVAGAIWRQDGGQWACVHAAPILKWMVGKNSREVRAYLERKRWEYEWVSSSCGTGS
jgi:hypothetical protein